MGALREHSRQRRVAGALWADASVVPRSGALAPEKGGGALRRLLFPFRLGPGVVARLPRPSLACPAQPWPACMPRFPGRYACQTHVSVQLAPAPRNCLHFWAKNGRKAPKSANNFAIQALQAQIQAITRHRSQPAPLTLNNVDREAAHRRFLVLRRHVLTGLTHRDDDLVEGDVVITVTHEGHLCGVDGF